MKSTNARVLAGSRVRLGQYSAIDPASTRHSGSRRSRSRGTPRSMCTGTSARPAAPRPNQKAASCKATQDHGQFFMANCRATVRSPRQMGSFVAHVNTIGAVVSKSFQRHRHGGCDLPLPRSPLMSWLPCGCCGNVLGCMDPGPTISAHQSLRLQWLVQAWHSSNR